MTKVYLVRNTETKALLGLYWSRNIKELWWEVDVIADPSDYEYTALPPHGHLAFDEDEPKPQQYAEMEDQDSCDPDPVPWTQAAGCENLDSAIHDAEQHNWRRLPYADQPGGGIDQVCKIVDAKKRSTEPSRGDR